MYSSSNFSWRHRAQTLSSLCWWIATFLKIAAMGVPCQSAPRTISSQVPLHPAQTAVVCQNRRRYGHGVIFDGGQGGSSGFGSPPLGSTGLVARSVSMFFRVNARQTPIMNCRVKPTLASQGATVLKSCVLSVPHWPRQTATAHWHSGKRAREKPQEGLA